MAVNRSPIGGVAAQFFDNSGNILSGGKIFTYAAGTTTPQASYTTAGVGTPHSNPIILDAAGRVPSGEIWLTDGLQYKFLIKTSADVQIGSYDNIIGINSNFVNYTNSQEIQTATAGQTVFTLTTMVYQPGTNSLSVFVDGVNQYGPGSMYAYQETSDTVVTFTSGLHVGADVKFTTSAINASSYGDAEQISYLPPFTGGVATNVELKLAQTVSVKDFGATGNGATDDTTAIQAALSSGAKTIIFSPGTYKVTASLSIPANVFIRAYGATVDASAITAHVFDFVDGGGMEGGTITGPGNASYSANSFALLCAGTNNAPAAPTFVNGPRIANVTLNGFGAYGVRLAYVNSPQIINCTIKNIGYAGIGGVSCNDGLFRGNTVEGVTPGNGSDAYGIFVDREDGTSEASDPRSYRCVISDNIVKNVSVTASDNGQGIDTHAGVDFTIANNIISQCEVGIFVTSSAISGVQALGSKNVTVTGNVIASTLRVGYAIQIAGAQVAGATVDAAENIVVSGNTVFGHGIAGDATSGAIRIQDTKNSSVVGNTIRQSSCNGILINVNNIGLLVSSNSIIDPFDNTVTLPACIFVFGSANSVHIEGNSFTYNDAALGTYVAVNSIRIGTSLTNLDVSIGRNNYIGIDATHLTYSPGTFTGVNPDGLYADRSTATIACVSGQASNQIAVTFAKLFPVAPSAIDLTITGAIAPGGKTAVLRTASITATGFTIIAYPYDLANWSASGNLDLSWRASV